MGWFLSTNSIRRQLLMMMSTLRVRRRTKRSPKQQTKTILSKSHITNNHHESKEKFSKSYLYKKYPPTFFPFPPKVFCITPNLINVTRIIYSFLLFNKYFPTLTKGSMMTASFFWSSIDSGPYFAQKGN